MPGENTMASGNINENNLNTMYQTYLGRDADAAGAQWWANAAKDNGWNMSQLATEFKKTLPSNQSNAGGGKPLGTTTTAPKTTTTTTANSYSNNSPAINTSTRSASNKAASNSPYDPNYNGPGESGYRFEGNTLITPRGGRHTVSSSGGMQTLIDTYKLQQQPDGTYTRNDAAGLAAGQGDDAYRVYMSMGNARGYQLSDGRNSLDVASQNFGGAYQDNYGNWVFPNNAQQGNNAGSLLSQSGFQSNTGGLLSQVAGNNDGILTADEVNKAYQDLFGRPADAAGLAFWQQNANEGNLYQLLYDGAKGGDAQAREYGVQSNLKTNTSQTWNTQEFNNLNSLLANPNANVQGALRFNTENNRWEHDLEEVMEPVGYTPVTLDPNSLAKTQADKWQANQYQMQAGGTVEDRLNALLNKYSDYMQRAAGQANMAMNRRGLSNSSMAVGAAQTAAIDSALPVVMQDANAFNQIGLSNQAAINRASSENASAQNQANTFNASAQNQAMLANMEAANQAARYFADAQNADQMQAARYKLEEQLRTINNAQERQRYLDGVASELIRAGLGAGVFASQDIAANWLGMIGDVFPAMGLSVTRQMASEASQVVI